MSAGPEIPADGLNQITDVLGAFENSIRSDRALGTGAGEQLFAALPE